MIEDGILKVILMVHHPDKRMIASKVEIRLHM